MGPRHRDLHLHASLHVPPNTALSVRADAARPARDESGPIRLRSAASGVSVAGLLFDFGGVLYDDTAWPRWLFQLVSRFGLRVGYAAFEAGIAPSCQSADEFDAGHGLRAYLTGLGLSCAQVDEALAAGRAKRRQLEDRVRPLPGVRATFDKLAATGIPIGLVCTAPLSASQMSGRLEQLGLSTRFQYIATAPELRTPAASSAPFRAAAAALHVAADGLGFVSRNASALAAAHASGLVSIAFNVDGTESMSEQILHFGELLSVIRLRRPLPLAA